MGREAAKATAPANDVVGSATVPCDNSRGCSSADLKTFLEGQSPVDGDVLPDQYTVYLFRLEAALSDVINVLSVRSHR